MEFEISWSYTRLGKSDPSSLMIDYAASEVAFSYETQLVKTIIGISRGLRPRLDNLDFPACNLHPPFHALPTAPARFPGNRSASPGP